MWLLEDRRSIVYHGRVRLDNASISSFALWVRAVLVPEYRARNEFRIVCALPNRVLSYPGVVALNPSGHDVSISDVQIRHAGRPTKENRGKTLALEDIENLPKKLQHARWFFEIEKNDLIAVFPVAGGADNVSGKAVVRVNYAKKAKHYNAVVTSGTFFHENIIGADFHEIK